MRLLRPHSSLSLAAYRLWQACGACGMFTFSHRTAISQLDRNPDMNIRSVRLYMVKFRIPRLTRVLGSLATRSEPPNTEVSKKAQPLLHE